ncbi:MAG TPA: polysaccharide pyruvyl transferase family protein [Bacillota bacterium]|nr:polysaccharide pyruvyl transferase family protein [Bacillota bacterium]
MKKVVYLGWLGFGNLGDEACKDVFIKEFTNITSKEGKNPIFKPVIPSSFGKKELMALEPNLIVLGGGSVIMPPYTDLLILAEKQHIPTAIWGSGMDWLSENELSTIRRNLPTKSLHHYRPHAQSIRTACNGSPLIGVRGPHTYRILKTIGCNMDHIQVVGDPGLLIATQTSRGDLLLPDTLDNSLPVIGVNWGTSFNRVFGSNEESTSNQLASALQKLSVHCKIVIYPVWSRDLPAIKELAAKIHNPSRVSIISTVPSLPSLVTLLKKCTLTINFKLHANIFSSAVGTPFISLGYRSKCYDFAASLDCEELVIGFNHPNLKNQIITKAQQILAQPSLYTKKIIVNGDKLSQKLKASLVKIASQI